MFPFSTTFGKFKKKTNNQQNTQKPNKTKPQKAP